MLAPGERRSRRWSAPSSPSGSWSTQASWLSCRLQDSRAAKRDSCLLLLPSATYSTLCPPSWLIFMQTMCKVLLMSLTAHSWNQHSKEDIKFTGGERRGRSGGKCWNWGLGREAEHQGFSSVPSPSGNDSVLTGAGRSCYHVLSVQLGKGKTINVFGILCFLLL